MIATDAPSTALSPPRRGHTRAHGGTQLVVLYDGHCRFCTQGAKKAARIFGHDRVRAVNFQDEGVLESYPGVSYDECMKKMQVIEPGGKVFSGAGAFARLFRTVRIVGVFGWLYYVPLLKQLADLGYFLIAKYRYKLFGKNAPCDPGGTCHLHE